MVCTGNGDGLRSLLRRLSLCCGYSLKVPFRQQRGPVLVLTLLVFTALSALLFIVLYASDVAYRTLPLPPPEHVFAYVPPAPAADSLTRAPPAGATLPRLARRRIAMVTMSQTTPNSHGRTIARWSWLNKMMYAARHGVAFYFHTRKHVSWWRPAVWGKLTILLHHLYERDETGRYRYEWVYWIDADTVIMEMDTTLEHLIYESVSASDDGRVQLIASGDRIRPLNAGVMLLRNSAWTRALLERALSVRYWHRVLHWAQEQQALTDVLVGETTLATRSYRDESELRTAQPQFDAVKSGAWSIVSTRRFNALNSEYRYNPTDERSWESSFLIHTAGCSSEARINCAENYEQRAWRLFLARWNTTTEALTAHAIAESGATSLAVAFPELFD